MKKILLLSDTHSYVDDRILDYTNQADEIWHAGDIGDIQIADKLKEIKPFRAVYGNIDNHIIRNEYPLINEFKVEGVTVFMTHIGGYPGKYSPNIKEKLIKSSPKLFISGHSHILKVMPDKNLNLLHMNPGAIGKHGFHQKRTMLRFDLTNGDIKNLEVIEFPK